MGGAASLFCRPDGSDETRKDFINALRVSEDGKTCLEGLPYNAVSRVCDQSDALEILNEDNIDSSGHGFPPDLVSLPSCISLDDSVSTISSSSSSVCKETSVISRPRSLFNKYWKANEDKRMCTPFSSSHKNGSSVYNCNENDDDSINTYEAMMNVHDSVINASPKLYRTMTTIAWNEGFRQSGALGHKIFTNHHSSAPILRTTPGPLVSRKTHSTPSLLGKPGHSCLRRTQAMMQKQIHSELPNQKYSGSVSFNPQVYVHIFDRLRGGHAKGGWSKVFA